MGIFASMSTDGYLSQLQAATDGCPSQSDIVSANLKRLGQGQSCSLDVSSSADSRSITRSPMILDAAAFGALLGCAHSGFG